VIPVARDRHLEVRPRSLPSELVAACCTVCVWVVRSEAIVYRGHVMRPPPLAGATDVPLRSRRYSNRPPNNRLNIEDDSDSAPFSFAVETCSPWDSSSRPRVASSSVSRSISASRASMRSVLRECRLEFVDARSLNSRFFSARYARLRSESAAPTSGDDPPGCRPRYRRRRPVVELRRGRNRSLDGLLPVRRPVSVVDLVPLLPKQS